MRTIGVNYPRLPYYSDWLTEVGADSPYGWFKLNETTGNLLNAGSGGAASYTYGSTSGLTRNVSGLLTYSNNKAFQFNNTATTWVNLGADFNAATLDLNNAVTFEAIVNFTSTSTGEAFVCGQNADSTGYFFSAFISSNNLAMSGFVQSYFDTLVSTTTSTAINTNDWYHVVYTFSANASTLYLNGEQVAQTALTNYTMGATTGTNTINVFSRFNGSYSQSRNSKIDEVVIYRTALSPTRIRAHAVVAGLYQ